MLGKTTLPQVEQAHEYQNKLPMRWDHREGEREREREGVKEEGTEGSHLLLCLRPHWTGQGTDVGDLLPKAAMDRAALRTDEHTMVNGCPYGICMQ